MAHNAYALFEYETTRDLYDDRDADIKTGIEELRLMLPTATVSSAMNWVRTYAMRRPVIERAASFLHTIFDYAGENDAAAEAIALASLPSNKPATRRWMGLERTNVALYVFLRRLHLMGDEHGMTLVVCAAGSDPKEGTLAFAQIATGTETSPLPSSVLIYDHYEEQVIDARSKMSHVTIESLLLLRVHPGAILVVGAVTYNDAIGRRDIGTILINLLNQDPTAAVDLPGYMEHWPELATFRTLVTRSIKYDTDDVLPIQRRPRKMARTDAALADDED